MRAYIAQIRSNLRLMGRDRAVLFFTFLFPLVFFFVFAQAFHAGENPGAMMQVISMVLIIGVMGNGFFGAGMRAVQDRETNVLRRFKVAPVGAAPIIVASLVSGLVSFVPTVLFFFLFAKVVYHTPVPPNLWSAVLFVCIALVCFRSLGMIIAAVVNSAQEAGILTQLFYLPMLFLSGATFPTSMMPLWVQKLSQFLPATYLSQGMQGILIGRETVFRNWAPTVGLIVTTGVALLLGTKLFRWEKEEKIAPAAKLWLLAVLAPFVLLGLYQAKTNQNIERAKILARTANRNSSMLFQNARIFVGNGSVIERGALLVRNGRIERVFEMPPNNSKSLNAELVDAAGKTILPGLIDMHVHIGAPGGVYSDSSKYADPTLGRRRLANYLYCGVTAVRSTGDWLHNSLDLRKEIASGQYLGAELFAYGPLFTAIGGHPQELIDGMPSGVKDMARREFLRQPGSPDEARKDVDGLKQAGVDGIKAVLEAGNALWGPLHRLDNHVYEAVIAQANADKLPSATHTGNGADVSEAVAAGTNSIEHGSVIDEIPAQTFEEMKRKGIAYDPTLSVYEGMADYVGGDASLLGRSLLQQVGPPDLLQSTERALKSKHGNPEGFRSAFNVGSRNLLRAYQTGVTLITGSDAGNMLVIHGPTVQHEMELWVKAGVPVTVTLQAATYNAARVLRADTRIGAILPGRDASFILVDGDPTHDITITEHINSIYFRGEHVNRTDLFEQDKY
jgi:imidazolonepropionase-like amidohydrolase/ABC-type multidrug transport system permease subunit